MIYSVNKILKRIFATFILLAFSIFIIPSNNTLNASRITDRSEAINELYKENIQNGLTLYKQQIKTLNNGITDPSDKNYKWNPHTVQWVDFSPKSGIKIVSFSGTNKDSWKLLTTRQAAKAYEAANPGWIVLAGVNGDFFDINGSGEPTSPFTQDGDMFRAEIALPKKEFRNTVGFKDDGTYIVGEPSISDEMYVRIYSKDRQTIERELPIATSNSTLSEAGINLITKDSLKYVDLTGYKVLVGSYDLCRVSKGGYTFVKGSIIESIQEYSKDINSLDYPQIPNKGYFYLASKDSSLDSISIDDYLKCEYKYTDEWKNVINATGYKYEVMLDGKPLYDGSTNDDIYTTHPRTVIGFKEDGSYVLMVVDGRGKESENRIGASLSECGELLKIAGCVEGYNFDGGGSSTLIVRNKYGTFNVVNTPSDGSERSDGNHVFAVMRDPSFIVDYSNTTHNEAVINLDVKNEQLFDNIKDLKVSLNDVTYPYESKELRFSGLTKETEYELKFTYKNISPFVNIQDATDEDYIEQEFSMYLETTDYDYPDFVYSFGEVTKNSVEIIRDLTAPRASTISNVVVHLGGKTYHMDSSGKLVIDSLLNDYTYSLYFEYDVLDETDNTVYHVESEQAQVSTLAYNVPKIISFNEVKKTSSSVTLSYSYEDSDRVVSKAYIQVNESTYDLFTKSGEERITKLDFASNDYTVRLVLEYEDTNGTKHILVSNDLTYLKPVKVELPVIELFEVNESGDVTYSIVDNQNVITSVILKVNEETYNLQKELKEFNQVNINRYLSDYTFSIIVSYTDYDGSTKTVNSSNVVLEKQTKALPVINSFNAVKSNNNIDVTYSITDDDKDVTSVYVLVNNDKIELSKKETNKTLNNIDFKNDVTIKLIIEYDNGNMVIESTSITLEKDIVKQKKCGKKTINIVVSLITTSSLLCFVLKKRSK